MGRWYKNSVLIMIICFFVIIFSIYQIITLAIQSTYSFEAYQNNETNNQIDELLQNPTLLNYENLSNIQKQPAHNALLLKMNLNPQQLTNLTPTEVDSFLRNKLLGLKVDIIQSLKIPSSLPLILNIWFWFWSAIGWCTSVFLGRVLSHIADRFSRKLKIIE